MVYTGVLVYAYRVDLGLMVYTKKKAGYGWKLATGRFRSASVSSDFL